MAMLVLMVKCRNDGGEDDNVEDDDGDAGLNGLFWKRWPRGGKG